VVKIVSKRALGGIALFALLGAIGALVFVSREEPETAAAIRGAWARRSVPAPNVLLVTLDTTRADRIGAYGYAAARTPQLDALARRGVLFEQAATTSPLTQPAHASILTGTYPTWHGVRVNGSTALAQQQQTLAEIYKERGYATGAFVGAFVLDGRWGLNQGFDVYDAAFDLSKYERLDLGSVQRPGNLVVDKALGWLEAHASEPFFAWVHLYDPHAPYDPPPPFGAEYAGRPYDGEVAYADACIGRLVAAAQARAGDRLVVAVTSDHGEALGAHGEPTHGFFVYQATLRVPLVLAGPGVPRGARRPGPARTADLAPTLLALAGAEIPPGLDGRDLLAGAAPREAYAETLYPRSFGWAPLFSYRLGTLKLVEAPRPELFDLGADPDERDDLSARRPAEVARLRQALAAFRGADSPGAAPAPDPEAAERLRALGYAAAAPAPPPVAGHALADPKDVLPSFREFEEASWAEARGDVAAAVAAYRRLVGREPANPVFRRSLAAALRRLGRKEEAAAVAAVGGDDAVLAHERALALAEAGRIEEAVRSEVEAIARNPLLPEPHNHLGVLEARRGRSAQALAALTEALRLDPNNAQAWNNQGNVLRALGRAAEAEAAYRRAAELAPAYADPLNGLGVLAVERRELEAAAAYFARVLAVDPRYGEARLNLAVVEASRGRPAAARALAEELARQEADPALAGRARAFLRALPP
jgi:arylsulfatase A-like enzyme/Flp pilus assembly protein TadD